MTHTNPGARSVRRRVDLDVTTVLAVLLPVLTLLAVLLVHAGSTTPPVDKPELTKLTGASVVCPAGVAGSSDPVVSTDEQGASGQVEVAHGTDTTQATLTEGQATRVGAPSQDPMVVTGSGALAPGLYGARFGSPKQLAATPCTPTAPDQWFTGVGAGAGHTSRLELVNPDAGPAVADVTVYGRAGTLDVPRLRGVSVPGHSSVRLDLGSIVPRRDELTLHVVTSRGRLASDVLDTFAIIGGSAPSDDWLPPQTEPTTSALLLGTPDGPGARTLVLANPGQDETRVSVKFVSPQSVFSPEGLHEVRLAPGAVKRVSLTDALTKAAKQGTFGIQVEATSPVTATLRSFVSGDLSHATVGSPVTTDTAAVVPRGDKKLFLAGATGVGSVTVVSRSADGTELSTQHADLKPGAGTVVDVPAKAELVSVVPSGTSVVAAIRVTGPGTAVLPLADLVRNGLIPGVRPGLP
ncbi:MAG: DUF5719 family protein [Nocardioides sp.]